MMSSTIPTIDMSSPKAENEETMKSKTERRKVTEKHPKKGNTEKKKSKVSLKIWYVMECI